MLNPESGKIEPVADNPQTPPQGPSSAAQILPALPNLDVNPFTSGPRRTSSTRESASDTIRHVRIHGAKSYAELAEEEEEEEEERRREPYDVEDDSDRDGPNYEPTSLEKKQAVDSSYSEADAEEEGRDIVRRILFDDDDQAAGKYI